MSETPEAVQDALDSLSPVTTAKVAGRGSLLATPGREIAKRLLLEVVVPMAKDLVSNAIASGTDMALYGDTKSAPSRSYSAYRSSSGVFTGATSPVRAPRSAPTPRADDYQTLIYTSRQEALEVLEQMRRRITRYGRATVGDLMQLAGVTSNYVDERLYWENLDQVAVRSSLRGYRLLLPEPESV